MARPMCHVVLVTTLHSLGLLKERDKRAFTAEIEIFHGLNGLRLQRESAPSCRGGNGLCYGLTI